MALLSRSTWITYFDGIDELLLLVDICIASAEFPEKLMGVADKKEALHGIASRYGCAVTGLTLGAAGSVIYAGTLLLRRPHLRLPGGCVDTTGAGDAFRDRVSLRNAVGKQHRRRGVRTANAVARSQNAGV